MIYVREATQADLDGIMRVERRSYPPWLQAPRKVLEERLLRFKILVAVERMENGLEEIRGFTTLVPAYLPLDKPNEVRRIIMERRSPHYSPWFKEYSPDISANVLWVCSTAVETRHQGKGIGSLLIEASLDLAKRMRIPFRASALKTEYHKKRRPRESFSSYLERVRKGEVKDRFLQPYVKKGFELVQPLPNYERGHYRVPPHLNYNVLAIKRVV